MAKKRAVKTLEEVIEVLQKYKEEISQKYKVKEIGVFGSFVRGEQKRGSDVDMLVEYYELPDLLELIDLELYLSRLLKKKVDLIEKSGIRKELKEKILNEAIYL
ncbi:nucleotidyltransferase [hot springs metagenome]|uniref:Nucleotidyltransferase n=1 Tax=hot springs metagenome TaxID=433727 RepID=A0A5J4L4N8_9ZZZZ